LNEPCGKVSKLRCRYHGWTYDLSGRLRGTPEFDGVNDFVKEDNGLVPLAVDIWSGLVWVHLDQPGQSLESYLAPLPEWSKPRGLEKLHFVRRQEYELECNWKVYVDNYLDGGYHVNTVHPGLAGVLDYSEYRTHIHGHTSVQTSPIKAAADADPTAMKTRTGTEAAYWWVFPNFMMNLYEGVMDTNLVLPLGPGRCKVIFDFFFADTQTDAAKQYIADSITVAHQVQEEDMGICAEVQCGLASSSFTTGRFSVKREIAGYYFHQLLARALKAEY
jgi:choline monooxygenase